MCSVFRLLHLCQSKLVCRDTGASGPRWKSCWSVGLLWFGCSIRSFMLHISGELLGWRSTVGGLRFPEGSAQSNQKQKREPERRFPLMDVSSYNSGDAKRKTSSSDSKCTAGLFHPAPRVLFERATNYTKVKHKQWSEEFLTWWPPVIYLQMVFPVCWQT